MSGGTKRKFSACSARSIILYPILKTMVLAVIAMLIEYAYQ